MKNQLTSVAIMLIASTLIIVGAIYITSAPPSNKGNQAADTQSQDILNNANLIPLINQWRVANGLTPFVEDVALTHKADDISYAAAQSEAPDFVGNGQITVSYRDLAGAAPQQYYSATEFLGSIQHSAATGILLGKGGSKIGAWATYHVATKGATPVPWVTIIVQ